MRLTDGPYSFAALRMDVTPLIAGSRSSVGISFGARTKGEAKCIIPVTLDKASL